LTPSGCVEGFLVGGGFDVGRSGAARRLAAYGLLAGGPLVELVGQVLRHLRCEPRTGTCRGDLEGVVLADEGDLSPGLILHDDLVGALAVDVGAHELSPFSAFCTTVGSPPDLRRPSLHS
jgi:hypothetical protein